MKYRLLESVTAIPFLIYDDLTVYTKGFNMCIYLLKEKS